MDRKARLLPFLLFALEGCISAPLILKTDALLPAQRSETEERELEFPVRFERFVDERTERSTIGFKQRVGPPTEVITDHDIIEVFETIAKRALERKGVRPGPSVLTLRGTVRGVSVTSTPLVSTRVDAQVHMALALVNNKTGARLWSKTYSGSAVGSDHQSVLAAAFNTMASALEQDDSLLPFKKVYLAHAPQGTQAPPPGAPAPAPSPKTALEREIEDLPGPRAAAQEDNYALVVGIEKYRDIKGVDFAASDASLMGRYLVELLGYPEENVATILNERATRSDIEKYFGLWLKNRATSRSRVFVYYAGHGAPNPKTGDAYLVPFDGDPNYLETTAYPLKSLYADLAALQAKEVILVLDSCFSGAGGRSVIAKGARPLVTLKSSLGPTKDNAVVFAATSGEQISTFYEEARHGLLTYFLLKGLKGAADLDRDGSIEVGELYRYLKPEVEIKARHQNIEQTPALLPELDSLGERAQLRLR